MQAEVRQTQSEGEPHLDGTAEVSGVTTHSTSAMNDTSSYESMPLGMEFGGEEPSDATPASDLQTIYEGQVLSQSFPFQVSRDTL